MDYVDVSTKPLLFLVLQPLLVLITEADTNIAITLIFLQNTVSFNHNELASTAIATIPKPQF